MRTSLITVLMLVLIAGTRAQSQTPADFVGKWNFDSLEVVDDMGHKPSELNGVQYRQKLASAMKAVTFTFNADGTFQSTGQKPAMSKHGQDPMGIQPLNGTWMYKNGSLCITKKGSKTSTCRTVRFADSKMIIRYDIKQGGNKKGG